VPNLTIGPPILKRWRAAEPDLLYDTHLMVERPMEFVEPFAEAGANILTLHIETMPRARRDLRAVRRLGLRVGVTLRPRTPLAAIFDVLDEVDLVLVMSVEPGFGGQELIPKTLNKVRELDLLRRKEGLHYRLEIDGGINNVTAPLAVAAGADVLVAGHAIFGSGDVAGSLKAMRAAIEGHRPTNIRL
jgi:ribulose-phosphate 3-epimerase